MLAARGGRRRRRTDPRPAAAPARRRATAAAAWPSPASSSNSRVVRAERERHHLVGDDVGGAWRRRSESRSRPGASQPASTSPVMSFHLLVDVHPPEHRGAEAEEAVDGAVVERSRALCMFGIGGRVELLERATRVEQELDRASSNDVQKPHAAVRPGAVGRRQLLERRHRLHDQEQPRQAQPDVVGGHQVEQRLHELVDAGDRVAVRRPTPRRCWRGRRAICSTSATTAASASASGLAASR